MKISRRIDPRALDRVKNMSDSNIRSYMVDSTMSLGVALDMWQHHNAPSAEVTMAVDAIVALWSEAERRGLTDLIG